MICLNDLVPLLEFLSAYLLLSFPPFSLDLLKIVSFDPGFQESLILFWVFFWNIRDSMVASVPIPKGFPSWLVD